MLGEASTAALRFGRACLAAGAAAALLPLNASHLHAEDLSTPYGWREVWVGADASTHVWLVYGGMTIAPFSDMFSDGLRLRVASGYGGYAAIEHDVRPEDPENPVQGLEFGPKAVTELWLNMGPSAWGSLDASWTSAHETYAGRVRTGYRLFDDVSVGLEARVDGNALDKDARGGLFLRSAWRGGEISVSGGVAGRFFEDARDMTDPYATLNWLTQY
jgi:hypothetical protein